MGYDMKIIFIFELYLKNKFELNFVIKFKNYFWILFSLYLDSTTK